MATKTTTLSCLALAVILFRLSNLGSADATKALYAFGDSYLTTGNGGFDIPPYGMTWPGYPAGRASDGRNQVDYLAELIGAPSPTSSSQLKNDSQSLSGVNFAQGGAGVTYAFGYTPLDTQVNQLESLVRKKVLSKFHLWKSVALVSLGINDYSAYNSYDTFKESAYAVGTNTTVAAVVDGIALNLVRLHGLGLRNIIVSNLASMACLPYITVASNYNSCSRNSTLVNETSIHNALLAQRVKLLKQELRGANLLILDQTKAFEHLFQNGTQYGFENPLVPCCTGKDDSVDALCGVTDSAGQPLYEVCEHPERVVIFDSVHPTQAAWQTVVNLYATVAGFTQSGLTLNEWIRIHRV